MTLIFWVDIFTVLSNLVFFLPAYEAFRLRRRFRALIYFFMCWASAFYHMCLAFDVCLFSFHFHHYLDFFFAQFLIIVAGSYLITFNDKYRYLEYWVLGIGAVGVALLEVVLPGDLLIQTGIVAFVFIGLVIYWIAAAITKKLPKYQWDMFLIGISLTAGSITLFVFQNSWYQSYWLIHSVWHIAAAFGQYYLIRIKDNAPYLIPAATRIKNRL